MGITFLYFTDREPGTIVKVEKNGKLIMVMHDDATFTPGKDGLGYGQTDSQRGKWTFTPCTTGVSEAFTLRKNGRWVRKGSPMKDGTSIRIGDRDKYYDPSF